MDETVIALIIFGALIGLNYLARNPRADGRGWRFTGMLTRIGVPMAVIGLVFVWVNVELGNHFNFWGLEPSARATFDRARVIGALLYLCGHFALFVSLLARLWLRFAAYLRKVGPKNFARNVGNLAWVVGKSGVKLYAMAVVAFGALHLVGFRNLAFLGLLKATLDGDSAAGARSDRRREEDNHHAEAWDDRCRQEGGRHVGASSAS